MERNIQHTGLTNLITLLLVAVCASALAFYSESLAGRVSLIFLGLGFLISVVGYFQMRLEDREAQERLEVDELSRSPKDSTLFEGADSEILPAKRAREQFEKIMVPVFAIFLFILEVAGCWLLYGWLQPSFLQPLKQPLMSMSLFAMFALILFLVGKYSAGLARLNDDRLLRPMASFMSLGAYLLFAVTIGIAFVQGGFERVDLYLARVMAVLLGLIAVETLFTLIFEIYRPRVKGHQARVLYDSRLAGYLARPEGLFTTAAHTLDYQFGFKVSETWVYRFLERTIGWIILAQGAVLLISSCFVFIEPTEQALLERFGKPVAGRGVLDPGFHLKLPWPIDSVYRHHTERIQRITVGIVPEEQEENEVHVWTIAHAKEEYNMLVASRVDGDRLNGVEGGQSVPPVNLVNINVPIQFKIKDLQAWVYNHADAAAVLEDLAYRETVKYLVSVDFFDLMAVGRDRAASVLKDRIQQDADQLELGAEIVFVGLQGIHPPVKAAQAFEEVVGAHQELQTRILEAQAFQSTNVPLARAQAAKTLNNAEAFKLRRSLIEAATANQFTNQLTAYRAAPEVFKTRNYLDAFVKGSRKIRKYIFAATNTDETIQLDLQDKLSPGLLDVQVEDR